MCKEMTALAVEIGGTKLQLAIGKADGTILKRRRGRVNPEKRAEGILGWVAEEGGRFLADCLAEGITPCRAGIGFGGPVESATGRVLTSHQIAGWKGVELKTWCEDRFGLPAVVFNDANAAGWAEYRLGAGAGTRNFFYMNIGSGIGGALILNGDLYDGQGAGGGEIGHTWIPDWTVETPGAAEKLEHLCSGWSIEQRIRAVLPAPDTPLARRCGGEPSRLTCRMLGEAAAEGDAFARREIDHAALGLSRAVANVITLFHPESVAVGGGVALMGEVLFEPLRRHVADRVFGPFRGRYRLLPCALGEDVVLAGALLLACRA
jgi:glucokinase